MRQLNFRKRISVIVGCAQSTIGALASVFAYILYHNFFDVQVILNVPSRDVASYMTVSIVFGVLSVISGLFLAASNE